MTIKAWKPGELRRLVTKGYKLHSMVFSFKSDGAHWRLKAYKSGEYMRIFTRGFKLHNVVFQIENPGGTLKQFKAHNLVNTEEFSSRITDCTTLRFEL